MDINICAEGSKESLNLHKGKKKLAGSLQRKKIDNIKMEAPYSLSKQVFKKVFFSSVLAATLLDNCCVPAK